MNEGVAIDNCILTYYLDANPQNEAWNLKYRYAVDLINGLQKKKIPIYIPAQVVMESLCHFPDPAKRQDTLDLIRSSFWIIPFDSKAAAIGATMLLKDDNLHKLRDLEATRSHIKTDAQILAACIDFGIKKIYSDDKHFLKMSNGQIDVLPLEPDSASNVPLFDLKR